MLCVFCMGSTACYLNKVKWITLSDCVMPLLSRSCKDADVFKDLWHCVPVIGYDSEWCRKVPWTCCTVCQRWHGRLSRLLSLQVARSAVYLTHSLTGDVLGVCASKNHEFLILPFYSLLAQNLHFQQISPTIIDFWYPLGCLYGSLSEMHVLNMYLLTLLGALRATHPSLQRLTAHDLQLD